MARRFELSRRKILAGVGAAGAASVGAGLGTSAYFSDTESFAGNELVAGALDLKVNWTEHYSDWSEDEAEGIDTVSMSPGDGLTGFPSTAPSSERMVYVSDPDQFMKNTAIEAFPDVLDNDDPGAGDYDGHQATLDPDDAICDLPADLDGVLSHRYRTGGNLEEGVTIGDPPNAQTTAPGDPLVSISDVKPGDFGEVTFGFHLCDNPGYVWLTGGLDEASENGYTEPELDSENEDGPDGETVELLDAVRAAVWYDTGADSEYGADVEDEDDGEGDNVFGPGEVLLPLTGSLRNVLSMLESGMFPLDATPVSTDGDGVAVATDASVPSVSGSVAAGDDHVDEVVVTGDDDRFGDAASNYQCADYAAAFGLDVVGTEILNPETAPIVPGTSYSGCTTITVDALDESTGTITLSSSGPVLVVSVKGGPDGEQVYVFSEPVVLDGAVVTTPGDHEISNVDVCCPVDGDDGDDGDGEGEGSGTPSRDCFPNSTTAYVGFEWWIPADVGNEIQGDSVSFDIGFYTEQCRHNDGSGPSDGSDSDGDDGTTEPL
ncbi:SipW-dependent-type signal peptide-containing protein [Haloarchaeobius baliensis]|uniref:SipW-dependent-type signal peptide-containing protein n=1 Tax=Haloarchaeobius baliensis TaxID=1670458 RepID=UPI003F885D58